MTESQGQKAMFEIDKNVPLPARGTSTGGKKYPFERMEVGDSFFVPWTQGSKNSVNSSAYWAKKRYGFGFTTRTDNDYGGIRVWRVA